MDWYCSGLRSGSFRMNATTSQTLLCVTPHAGMPVSLMPCFTTQNSSAGGQVGSAPKFGCSRIKTTTDFCALHARREVTSAAHLCVLSGAGRYAPLVVQIGWNDDGSRANRD